MDECMTARRVRAVWLAVVCVAAPETLLWGATPAGATMPVNDTDTKSGMVSLMVATSGMRGLRESLVTAIGRRLPASTSGSDTVGFSKVSATWPATTSWMELPPPL